MYDIKLLKALADETRLNIILNLMKKERGVSEIVLLVNKSQPNVSISLKKLEEAGLIIGKKQGKQVFYSIKDRQLVEKILALIKNE
jgi:ArsR family transcriptional regulator, repressor of sdpIR and other operons